MESGRSLTFEKHYTKNIKALYHANLPVETKTAAWIFLRRTFMDVYEAYRG